MMTETESTKQSSRWKTFSVRFLLICMIVSALAIAWVTNANRQVVAEDKIVAYLQAEGVEIHGALRIPTKIEKLIGVRMEKSRYKVKLKADQNDFLYELGQLEYVVNLDFDSCDHSISNLLLFDSLTNLKKLTIGEIYNLRSFTGAQELPALKEITINGQETVKEIDLSALKDHPSLEWVYVEGWSLDADSDFQKFTPY